MLIRLQQDRMSHDIDTTITDTFVTRRNLILFLSPGRERWDFIFHCEDTTAASRIFGEILTAWDSGARAITVRHERGYEYRNADGDYMYEEPVLEIQRSYD